MNSKSPRGYEEHCMFRHCDKPTDSPVGGSVSKGNIPLWLEGRLIRNGSGIRKFGNTQFEHLYDGMSVVHEFFIQDGKASYRSRILETEAYKRNTTAGRIVVGEFGTRTFPDPCQSVFGWLQTKFLKLVGMDPEGMPMTDSCSVNIGFYGDQLYAMTETGFLRRVDPETLECVGDKTLITDYCTLNTATAHPHTMEDGTTLNVGMRFFSSKGAQYCFVRVPPASNDDPDTAYKRAQVIAQIPSRWKFHPGYYHSFAMTKTKLILVEQPYVINLLAGAAMPVTNCAFIECLKWYGDQKTIFHVVDLHTGQPHSVKYETDKLFLFHHINAYEDMGCLVVDVAGYDDPNFIESSTIYRLTDKFPSRGASPRRYVLPLDVNGCEPGENLLEKSFATSATAVLRNNTKNVVDVTAHRFTEDLLELPKINDKFNGVKYRFFYGTEVSDKSHGVPYMDRLVKIDVVTGQRWVHTVSGDSTISEPTFIADPTKADGDEDSGVILSPCLYENDPTLVSLLILDAKDMTLVCDIQFRAAGTVPLSYHGVWRAP